MPNNDAVGYTIVTANDTTRPYKPCFYFTTDTCTSGTPFPGTSNVTAFTPAEGCVLTEITENEGVITFKYNAGEEPEPSDVANTIVEPETVKVLKNGRIVIIRGKEIYTVFGQKIQ